MMRLPRPLPVFVLACVSMLALRASVCRLARGQETPKPADSKPADAKPADNKAADNKAAAVPAAAPAAPTAVPEVKPAEPAAPAAPEKKLDENLLKTVDDFWHYGKVARYDLAAEAGKK